MKACGKCWGTGKVIDHAHLGRVVRGVRRQAALSLRDMAQMMGISESHLSLLERGKRAWTQKLYDKALNGRV